jgi:hypothetical protein
MSGNRINNLLQAIIIGFPVLFLIILTCQFWLFDYEIWVDYFLRIADKEDYESTFKEKILSRSTFGFIRFFLIILSALVLLLSIFLLKKINSIFVILNSDRRALFELAKVSIKSLSRTESILLLFIFCLFIARALFVIINTELQYDEAWTFVHFSSKGVVVSALSPNNNHTLYTIFSAILWKLNLDAKLAVRLPALIFASVAFFSLFISLRKTIAKELTIVLLAVISFSVPFYFFSVLGRGYAAMLLFIIISVFSVLNMKDDKHSGLKGRVYFFSTVLGMYSNPAFLYVWIANVLVFTGINFRAKKQLFNFYAINIFAAFVTILLFSPIFLGGGLNTLSSAAINNIETGDTLSYLNRLSDWFFLGKKLNIFFVLVLIALVNFIIFKFCFKYKDHKVKYWIQFYWIFPFIVFLSTAVESPYRIWFWMPIFFWIQAFLIIYQLKLRPLFFYFISISIVVANFYFSQGHYFMNWSLRLDREAKKISEKIIAEKVGFINCYSFSRYDKPLLDYYFLINNRASRTYMPFKESRNYKPFEEMTYDAVLLDTEEYKATQTELNKLDKLYRLIYQNERIKLYINSAQ